MKNIRIMAVGVLIFVAGAVNTAQAEPFFNGFEVDDTCWVDVTRVASGGGALGVSSATGGWHAETLLDGPEGYVFTRWGGYGDDDDCDSVAGSLLFPEGGYGTSVDVYLDVDVGAANDSRIDYSSAINNEVGNHRRDFIFHCGFYSDDRTADGLGSGNRYICSVSNNSPGWPANPARDPVVVATESGWYSLRHYFYDDGTGTLAVDLGIFASDGTLIKAWTLSDPADVINSTVGGNRYGWFINQGWGAMAIDNTLRVTGGPVGITAVGEYKPVPVLSLPAAAILVLLTMVAGAVGIRRLV